MFNESNSLGVLFKMGGKFHLKLNIDERPIANKYREGKLKRTLKRELNQYLKLLRGSYGHQCMNSAPFHFPTLLSSVHALMVVLERKYKTVINSMCK